MSTSGGSRGERHAKPKFNKIDINTLHTNIRGETSEPSTQNRQAPPKHGMQSLGKVPQARRPANSFSVKTESSSTSDNQQNTTWNSGNANNTENQIVSTNSGSVVTQHSENTSTLVNSSSNNLQQNYHLSNTQNSNSNLTNNSSGSATWSSVTTGSSHDTTVQPPLFPSSQFQHEFPSLDGSMTTGSKGSHHGSTKQQSHVNLSAQVGIGSGNSQQEMNLRPQTNVGNWTQQQSQNQTHQQQSQNQSSDLSGGGRGENIGNGPNSQQVQAHQNSLPQPLISLLPSFITKSHVGGGSQGLSGGMMGQNKYGGNQSYNPTRPRSQPGAQSQAMYDQHYSGSGHGANLSRKLPNAASIQNKRQDDKQSLYMDSDLVHHQRPIIKPDELERIETIAQDDGWDNHDDIDYTQKLEFSDDDEIDNETNQQQNNNVSNQKSDRKTMNTTSRNKTEEEDKRAGKFLSFFIVYFKFYNFNVFFSLHIFNSLARKGTH